MICCHKPVPPYKYRSIAVIGFTDYKWYCLHNPSIHKKLKKIGKYILPFLVGVSALTYILDYFF